MAISTTPDIRDVTVNEIKTKITINKIVLLDMFIEYKIWCTIPYCVTLFQLKIIYMKIY